MSECCKATRENGFRVYFPSRFEETYERKRLEKIRDMFVNDRIDLDEIRQEPSRYLMLFRAANPEK